MLQQQSHSKMEEQGQRRGISDQCKTETELGKYQTLYLHVWYTGFVMIESSELHKAWEALFFQFYHLKQYSFFLDPLNSRHTSFPQ